MAFAITCTVAPGALPHLRALRAEHLAYVEAHLGLILFGGPARGADGTPETMLIVVKTEDRQEAEGFIHREPYTASGVVFSDVLIRPWSQVVPEAAPHALRDAIEAERRAKRAG